MSIVAVKVYDDKIVVGSDSIMVRGYTQTKSENKFSKLVKTNDMIVGAVGAAEEFGLFQIYCSTRKPERPDESGVLNFFSEFATWKHGKTGKFNVDNYYILVFDGKAFCIQRFFVEEIVSFQAIGAGTDYALSALHLGHDVSKSIETACDLSIYCVLPVVEYVWSKKKKGVK